MHPRKHAAHALDKFMSPLRLGSITLAGEEHLYSDMTLTFGDWMHFYFSEFAQGADPSRVQDADVMLGLMRDEDITQYEDQLLGMEGIHGIEDLYLQAGLYDVVQKLTNWGAIRDEEISHVFPPGLRELPQNKRTYITRGEKLELCMKFRKFGLIGTSPAMVRMYAYVDRKCCLARESPSSFLPNFVIFGEPGPEKEFLRNAICKLSGWPEDLLLVARSAPEDLTGAVGIPCLRDRAVDIPLLVNHFLQHELRESDLDSLRFPLARACWWRTLGKLDAQKLNKHLFELVAESSPSPSGTAEPGMVPADLLETPKRPMPPDEPRSKRTGPAGQPTPGPQQRDTDEQRWVFRLEGESWRIVVDGELQGVMNDRKGMHYIAHLLARPSEVIDCTTLRAHIDGISAPRPPNEVLKEVVRLIASGEMSELRASDLGPQIDRKGIRGINARVCQIESDELPAATGGEKIDLEDELRQLKIALSSAVGIGGRSRRVASKAEADRKHVSRRYRDALRAAEESKMCALTTHLKSNLTVGASCSYSPETEISWFT